MTPAVQKLLDSFNALSPSEKHEAAAEIFRRTLGLAVGDPRTTDLVEAMDEVFGKLGVSVSEHQIRPRPLLGPRDAPPDGR